MAMWPCENCLENNWKTEYQTHSTEQPDGSHLRETFVIATCQNCGIEIEFGHREKVMRDKDQKGFYVMKDGKHFWDAEDGSSLVEMDVFRINKKGGKDPNGKAIKVMAVWKK